MMEDPPQDPLSQLYARSLVLRRASRQVQEKTAAIRSMAAAARATAERLHTEAEEARRRAETLQRSHAAGMQAARGPLAARDDEGGDQQGGR